MDDEPRVSDDDLIVELRPDFSQFYEREYREVVGLAFVLSNSVAAAEELAQEAFEAAFRTWHEVSQMSRPDAWVRRVVVNKAASRIRRLVAEARAHTRIQAVATYVPDTPADSLAVWSEIGRLPRRQAEVVALVYYAGLSHREVAELIDCSIDTVRTHLKRAKARLAKVLRED